MRILHVANFSWFNAKYKRVDNMARYYAPDRKISNGLIRNGHSVWNFSYRDTARYLSPLGMGKKMGAQSMNEYLIAQACTYQPQLLLLGHCELLLPETIATIRQKLPNCKIAQWWVDPFNDYAIEHLSQKLPLLDAFFATSAPSYYRQLIASTPTGDTIPPLYYFPNITDSSIEVESAFTALEYEHDLLFIGADSPERADLLHRIQQLSHLKCGFFGFDGKVKLTGAEFIATFGKSKMGLNLSRATDIPLYSSDRLAQLTGNGVLTFTPQTPQMDILFSRDEVVYYNDETDLCQKIQHYHADSAQCKKIAQAGWERAHSSYNERRITQFMVEAALDKNFSEPYEWLD